MRRQTPPGRATLVAISGIDASGKSYIAAQLVGTLRRIAAVGPGCHITADARRAAWTAMASGAAVGESSADLDRCVDVSRSVGGDRPQRVA
jgi:hypothetical protein